MHLADFDYLPFGVLECMALGKPCLCTDVGGIPDVIRHDLTGLLIKPGDIESASEYLINLLSDPSECRRLGDEARRLVLNRYNLDSAVESLKEMYMDTIEGKLKEEYGK